MEWVHNELFFVGNNINPPYRNSLSILSVKKQGALFCLYQANVLNDILLSIGIKSRIIRCLPYEYDMDCHGDLLDKLLIFNLLFECFQYHYKKF